MADNITSCNILRKSSCKLQKTMESRGTDQRLTLKCGKCKLANGIQPSPPPPPPPPPPFFFIKKNPLCSDKQCLPIEKNLGFFCQRLVNSST